MKTLMLCLVMLAVICLCAVSANADITIDSFNYPNTAALDAVWTNSPTMTTIGVSNTPVMDIYVDNTTTGYAFADAGTYGSWNLTGITGATLTIAASQPSQVLYAFVLFGDNNGDYWYCNMFGLSNQLQDAYGAEAAPAGNSGGGGAMDWSNITVIAPGYYADPSSGPVDVYVSKLTVQGVNAVPEPGSLLALGFGLLGTAGLVIRRRF